MAACGVASEDEDDDAESATYRHPKDVVKEKKQTQEAPPTINAEQALEIDELIESTKSDRAALLNWVSQNTNTNCTEVSGIPNVAYVHVKNILTKKAGKEKA